MTVGTYQLDGVDLDDPSGRWLLSEKTLLGNLPAPVLTSTRIPGRHGVVAVGPTVRDVGSRTVGLLVTDNDATGVETGNAGQVRKNLTQLYNLAAPVGRLPVLRFYPDRENAPTDFMEAPVRLVASVDPEPLDGLTVELVLPFELPGVYFRDGIEATIASASTASWSANPSELSGSTGSITDPMFLLAGPLTAATITDTSTGRKLMWSGTVAANQFLRIQAADLSAFTTSTAAWTGGTEVSGGLSTGPDGFDLNPNAALQIAFTLTRTGGSGVNQIRARKAYL